MPRHPDGIDIRRIDKTETRRDKGVEQREGGFFVGGPAEDIAAQAERRNMKAGASQLAHFHG